MSAALLAAVLAIPAAASDAGPHGWSAPERALIESLWLGNLVPLPPDPSNGVADDRRAARLGHALFFDTRLSANGQVACATCHRPELAFTDGLALARGVGTAGRSAMAIAGTAYSPWLFWDGRKDSQWAQALGPLESAVEHGGDRTRYAHVVAGDAGYRAAYEALFGPLPDLADAERFPPSAGPVQAPAARAAWHAMQPGDRDSVSRVYANLGKAIAAYERLIQHGGAAPRGRQRAARPGRARARGAAPVRRSRAVRPLPQRPVAHERLLPQHRYR